MLIEKRNKIKALLFVFFMVMLSAVGTLPMIMGHGIDGGGSGYCWDSAEAYPNSAFTASASRTGHMYARKTGGYTYGRVDIELTKTYTPSQDGYIKIKIYYEYNWYTDVYWNCYLGTPGLKNPLGHYKSQPLTLIDPDDYAGGFPASDIQYYTYTYMEQTPLIYYIEVDGGTTYTLIFYLQITSSSSSQYFHKVGQPSYSAHFCVENLITFYTSIP